MLPAPETPSRREDYGLSIALGCMAVLLLLICIACGGLLYAFRRQIPVVRNYVPTELPTPTATPLVHQPASDDKVIRDDFSNNDNKWFEYNSGDDNDLHVRNGKLVLSPVYDHALYAECQACVALGRQSYLQADFSTEAPTNREYGIVFNSSQYHLDFYIFLIDRSNDTFALYKVHKYDWSLRLSRKSSLIRPHPNVNTLAVETDGDLIRLYINNQMVESYQDTGNVLAPGTFSFYVDGAGLKLIIDNVLAYGK